MGSTFYYGCRKDTPYKWLDIGSLARQVLPRHEIHRFRYFTARVTARPDNPGAPNRQGFYLRALATTPGLSIHLGRFQRKKARMRLTNPPATGPATVEVIKVEEKGSDVNLATYLVADAFRGDSEAAVVIRSEGW